MKSVKLDYTRTNPDSLLRKTSHSPLTAVTEEAVEDLQP